MVERKAPNQYHHGQLKKALLEAIDSIIRTDGVEALSLREAARRAGVSHGAPAHHFGDKRGMLTAYAIEGYEKLMGAIAFQLDDIARDNLDQRLVGYGLGYIDFATFNPAQFSIMQRLELLDASDDDFVEKRQMPFALLKRLAAEAWSNPNAFGWNNQNMARLSALWSMIHGAALLSCDGSLADAGDRGMLDPRPSKILEQAVHAFKA